MKTKIIVIAICLVAVASGALFAARIPRGLNLLSGSPASSITNFDQCKNAGYPVMESFPEQCRTPQGKVFIADVKTSQQGCQNDISCGQAKWCDQGVCKSIEYTYDCQQDSDCQMINQDNGFGCCYAGQCDPIDYSQSNWIAVNKEQYAKQQTDHCPSTEQCGPAPACPTSIKPSNYVVACQKNICTKTERIAPVPKKNPPLEPNKN